MVSLLNIVAVVGLSLSGICALLVIVIAILMLFLELKERSCVQALSIYSKLRKESVRYELDNKNSENYGKE